MLNRFSFKAFNTKRQNFSGKISDIPTKVLKKLLIPIWGYRQYSNTTKRFNFIELP